MALQSDEKKMPRDLGRPRRLQPSVRPAAPRSRRAFLHDLGLLAASMGLSQAALQAVDWIRPAQAATPDLAADTLNGLVAFVVPGPDPYSQHQGAATVEPGGLDAGITDALIENLDFFVPLVPPLSTVLATVLDQVALGINPAPIGPFRSPFANLSFVEKVFVFQFMESDQQLAPLAPAALGFPAYLAYSAVAVFDPETRTLTGQPVGWTISGYEGVADGRNDFKGYFQNRRRVD